MLLAWARKRGHLHCISISMRLVFRYGCGDHFLESDTLLHAWEAFATLLEENVADGMICDVGM